MFRILAIGDITSPKAAAALTDRLWSIRQEHHIDFTVINAENAGFIIGPSPDIAREYKDRLWTSVLFITDALSTFTTH